MNVYKTYFLYCLNRTYLLFISTVTAMLNDILGNNSLGFKNMKRIKKIFVQVQKF